MPQSPKPHRALALSGGAVFGAYQAGAWAALEESGWRPDFAAGISIGAVNSWLLSRGANAAAMREMWIDLPERLLPTAPAAGLPWKRQTPLFRAWLEEVYARYQGREPLFPMELITLAVPRISPHIIQGDSVGITELLAACSLIGVLPAVEIDGRRHMDFGPVRNIPRDEALATGADDVVIVDLLHSHPVPGFRKLKKAALRALAACGVGERESDASPRERWIGHEQPLGGPIESFQWSRAFAERLWSTGYDDACRVLRGRHAA